jgi:protein-disulfide isomerase
MDRLGLGVVIMNSVSLSRAAHAVLLVALIASSFISTACQRVQKEALADEQVGRPGDCPLLQQRVCALAGDTGPACQAAKIMIPISTDAACGQDLKNFGEVQRKFAEIRKPCSDIVATICAKTGEQSEICETVTSESASLQVNECLEMRGKEQKLIDDLERQQLAKHPLDAAHQAQIAEGEGPTFGPKDAKVTLVEFADFQCPYCAQAARVSMRLREEYGDRVRFIFRQFPLPMHENAQIAARAALAAQAQGKFWPYHDLLFANQGKLDRDSLIHYAQMTQLNLAKFKVDLDSDETNNLVLGDQIKGAAVVVKGTPTLFINGRRATSAGDYDEVSKTIDAALAGG